ncbi:RNA dependent RNA polymerase [Rosellinia necatrix partitivirus 8]|uniref:RNA dependent RNA polymerase n=1 Tax=Rosellinia necatrix partitivirus 8 TaxID=2025333 RepID=UPI000C7F0D7A|nr:RNA dependent RNA polymerase [Rosellinia necatrix partitivirus 8]BBC21044.1 RNA dependent RNA polymerase [Rosellinia necatrix partitivirus 8]
MLTLFTIVTLNILLRFQQRRRRNETTSTLIHPIRNILFEWEFRRSIPLDASPYPVFDYSKSLLAYIDLITCHKISIHLKEDIYTLEERYSSRDENFHLYEYITDADLPPDRQPANGISHAERRYHSIPSGSLNVNDKIEVISNDPDFIETNEFRSNILFAESLDLTGSPPHPQIEKLIQDWFPQYVPYLHEYCRPPSFGPQAFLDFNRDTPDPQPPTPERHEAIMRIVRLKMNIKPYRPLHFADALAAETPLNTSASYYSKFNPETRVLARYSTPSRYSDMPTSKGYFINVMLNEFRLEFHHIKYDGMPFPTDRHDHETNLTILDTWLAKHPAQLFIRTQISKRDPSDPKKIRPVYSVDDRFLHIEKTVSTPLLAQMRNPQCCVAHGLETFRGSMSLIDKIAHFFLSFISLDWSQFDQRLPYYVIIAFFLDFLASLIIVSHGYMPTRSYPDTKSDIHSFARRQYNVLVFLTTWYLSMTFLSFDGFAFIRIHGGVPSGLLNTQSLDSFGNMYIITDCLLEFGFTEQECLEMLFCVLGDDNLIFLQHNLERITRFMVFLERYSKDRHGMVLSILKSMFSNLRTKITFLSYENFFGHPSRPIGKLVAQLAFPERPVPPAREWIHAARALGLAYASCGQDPTFHLLCKMVYERFRPSVPVPTLHINKIFKKWKYQLPDFDIEELEYTFPDFPTCTEIFALVSDYHGVFSETDKWNFNVFTVPPSDNLPDYVTLKNYIQQSPDVSHTVNEFWHGKRPF